MINLFGIAENEIRADVLHLHEHFLSKCSPGSTTLVFNIKQAHCTSSHDRSNA